MKRNSAQMRIAIRVLAAASLGFCASTHAAIEQAPDGSTYIHVDDPRPVDKAATELSRHYRYAISYEDPAYQFSDDIRDVTESVSKHPNAHSASQRILVPAGGILDARWSKSAAQGREAVAASVRAVLEAQAAAASGGRFGLEESPGMLHIVPTEIRGKNGEWIQQSSVLVQPITVPAGDHSGLERLRAITTEVSRLTGQTVKPGTVPLNPFFRVSKFPARSGPARDILIDLLKQTGPNLTWRLLYGPDMHEYYLNIVSFAQADDNDGVTPSLQN